MASISSSPFPWPTAFVNVVGSFLLGIFFFLAQHGLMDRPLQLLFMTGLLGGFTTFSAYSVEILHLFQAGKLLMALAYALGSVVSGVVAAYAGFTLCRLLLN